MKIFKIINSKIQFNWQYKKKEKKRISYFRSMFSKTTSIRFFFVCLMVYLQKSSAIALSRCIASVTKQKYHLFLILNSNPTTYFSIVDECY